MRDKIKQIFLYSNNEFISGEELSKNLNISRTAVWKHIEELKKTGYKFEAVRKKGYRLLNNPDDISAERIKSILSTKWLGKEIFYYEELESTQKKAHELAKNDAKHGTIVIAEKQTQGRGRLGRSWHSEKGKGLWMSIILRPTFSYQQAPAITLFTSVMIVQTLKNLYEINVMVKWPNDIYIEGKKCAGILTEMHGEQDQIHYIIIGIGINTQLTNYPVEIQNRAVSLETKLGFLPKRLDILQQLLSSFEQGYKEFIEYGFDKFYDEYNNSMLGKGNNIVLKQFANEFSGKIEGVDRQGYLLIRNDKNEIIRVTSGDIEF